MENSMRRAVQIDLARQIETLPTVFRAFDQAKAAGMDMVVLYLEDRIKTATYPYSPDEESYSPAQIKEMIAYADRLGLELVPVVEPIGHAERFMRHPELQHLAELRGNIAGRFTKAGENKQYSDTCPLLPETAEFFDAYITEVAELFPSKYFHLGFDEIFNMGYCELCRKVVKEQGLAVLFRDSLIHYHDLLKGLGKEVMIWDDMLEHCESIIPDLPKDLILCAWFYRYYPRNPEARFNTSRRYDMYKLFERWGFRYFGCTNITVKSIDTLTAYSRKYQPMGMLMTCWELRSQQEAIAYLGIRYAGLLWNENAPIGFDTLLRAARCFADTDEAALALATAATYTLVGRYGLPELQDRYFELNKYRATVKYATVRTIRPVLEAAKKDSTGVVMSYLIPVQQFAVTYRLRELYYQLLEYRTGEKEIDREEFARVLAAVRRDIQLLKTEDLALWEEHRPGIPSKLAAYYDAQTARCDKLEQTLAAAKPGEIGRLDLHFCLPEYTAACRSYVTLHYADGTERAVLGETVKSMFERDPYYDAVIEIPADKVPTAVTLGVSGIGATGFCYVDATMPGGDRFIPVTVCDVHGKVEHPEFLLADDSRAAIFGEQDMFQAYNFQPMNAYRHAVTVNLERE